MDGGSDFGMLKPDDRLRSTRLGKQDVVENSEFSASASYLMAVTLCCLLCQNLLVDVSTRTFYPSTSDQFLPALHTHLPRTEFGDVARASVARHDFDLFSQSLNSTRDVNWFPVSELTEPRGQKRFDRGDKEFRREERAPADLCGRRKWKTEMVMEFSARL